MRKWNHTPRGKQDDEVEWVYQIVVPQKFRQSVLRLAHDHLWSGHLGINKTYQRVLKHFFWPGLKSDIARYCKSCHVCQVSGKPNQSVPPAPLCPIPAVGEPFERVLVDCVGPLPRAKSGAKYLLTMMCASTRFPEVIPLRNITAKSVVKALMKFFTTFGLPKIVQSDQGSNFLSRVFRNSLKALRVSHVVSSAFHPESQGALERWHQTLKSEERVSLLTHTLPVEVEDDLTVSSEVLNGGRMGNSELLLTLPSQLSYLSHDQARDIQHLLGSFPDLFSDVPRGTTILAHDINVGDSLPIKQHAYRCSVGKREALKSEVDYLLRNGFAVPSSSPWSSPCVLVPKADGTFRFCTDFRKINSVTVPDAFPLPRIDDCIDNIGAAKYITKLDLLKGYWQVPLTERGSAISAFVTPDAFLQYTWMAFGLRNAPATFQRLMSMVLGNVPHCSVYLDDVVIYSLTWADHLSTLSDVFRRLSAASLTLNLQKCEFAKASVTYLGKQVGNGLVKPLDLKISAILEYPMPTTRRELRRFLGMVGYYRCFCKNFSSVVAPLTKLRSPKVEFCWTDDCHQAFHSAKSLLCSAPVLSAPDVSRAFQLEVDASAVGAGAVLLQEGADGVAHPVSYFSAKFNRHQLNYSTIEKETLALLLALRHFEVYVGGSLFPVIVHTDHNPLVFLSKMYNHNQRLMRWALMVQPYNLEIRHKRGTENVVADALSCFYV